MVPHRACATNRTYSQTRRTDFRVPRLTTTRELCIRTIHHLRSWHIPWCKKMPTSLEILSCELQCLLGHLVIGMYGHDAASLASALTSKIVRDENRMTFLPTHTRCGRIYATAAQKSPRWQDQREIPNTRKVIPIYSVLGSSRGTLSPAN